MSFNQTIEELFSDLENCYYQQKSIYALELVKKFQKVSAECRFPFTQTFNDNMRRIRVPRFRGVDNYIDDVQVINNKFFALEICSYMFYGIIKNGEISASIQSRDYVLLSLESNQETNILSCARFSSDFDDANSFQLAASTSYEKYLA